MKTVKARVRDDEPVTELGLAQAVARASAGQVGSSAHQLSRAADASLASSQTQIGHASGVAEAVAQISQGIAEISERAGAVRELADHTASTPLGRRALAQAARPPAALSLDRKSVV